MDSLSSKTPNFQPEIFEAEKGMMTLRYEPGMSLERILEAFGVVRTNQIEAGREILSYNKFKIAEGMLAKEDGRSISPRTLVFIPKKFVSQRKPALMDGSETQAIPAKAVAKVTGSMGILTAYRAEFKNLMEDRNARITLYSGAIIAIAIGVSTAVGIYSISDKRPKAIAEATDEEQEGEAVLAAEWYVPIKKKAVAGVLQLAEAPSELPAQKASQPVPQTAPSKAGPTYQGEFVFTSNSRASDLKAAIEEMNAIDQKKQKR